MTANPTALAERVHADACERKAALVAAAGIGSDLRAGLALLGDDDELLATCAFAVPDPSLTPRLVANLIAAAHPHVRSAALVIEGYRTDGGPDGRDLAAAFATDPTVSEAIVTVAAARTNGNVSIACLESAYTVGLGRVVTFAPPTPGPTSGPLTDALVLGLSGPDCDRELLVGDLTATDASIIGRSTITALIDPRSPS